ncbi:MAG TPA: hypothetical protein VLF43_04495, partial [Candidatus Saccharimonadales bacterium]|nr:hypothetical protein [Candidatus Saccharimonadales bacterium]
MSAEHGTTHEQSIYGLRRRTQATLLAGTLLVTSACTDTKPGNGSETPAPQSLPTATSHAVPRTVQPTKSPACKLPGAGYELSIRTDNTDVVQVSRFLVGKAIDMAPHKTNGECYEQITFRFGGKRVRSDPLPGLHARYVKKPVLKPSDIPVTVAGNAYVEVDIGSWWYKSGGGEGPQKITDPRVDNIQVVQQTQNNEGYSTWVVGVNEKQPFTIKSVSGTEACPQLCYALE